MFITDEYPDKLERVLNYTLDYYTQTVYNKDEGKGKGNWGHSGRPGKVGGSSKEISAEGENEACTGFKSSSYKSNHISKHKFEFGNIANEEYLKKGIELLQKPCGGDIDGYIYYDVKEEKCGIARFNRVTTELAIGFPGEYLKTYYKAKYDKKNNCENVEKANKFFDGLKKKAPDTIKQKGSENSGT